MRGFKAPWLHFGEKRNKGTYLHTDERSDNVTSELLIAAKNKIMNLARLFSFRTIYLAGRLLNIV